MCNVGWEGRVLVVPQDGVNSGKTSENSVESIFYLGIIVSLTLMLG